MTSAFLTFGFAAALGFAATAPAAAAPLVEILAGTWTCQAKEGKSDVAMTLNYRRSDAFLVGEIEEDSGAVLLDVWLDDGEEKLALRRILSYDATIEMKISEQAETGMTLEGEMRHVLGSTAKVRETFRFAGSDEFHAIWEDDSGEGWHVVMERSCRRI